MQAPFASVEQRDLIDSDEWTRTMIDSEHQEETPIKIRLGSDLALGFASFDFEVHFPCFALFLDSSNSLLLRATGKGDQEFQRIGVARFLRTRNQAKEAQLPLGDGRSIHYSSNKLPIGPMGPDEPRSDVRIV